MTRRTPRRAPRHARRDPEAASRGEPAGPIAPGAWGARSRVPAAPEPVVWPEAGSADVPPAPPATRRVTPPPPSPSDRLSDPGAGPGPGRPSPSLAERRPEAAAAGPAASTWSAAGRESARAAASRPGGGARRAADGDPGGSTDAVNAQSGPPRTVRRRAGAAAVGGAEPSPGGPAAGGARGPVAVDAAAATDERRRGLSAPAPADDGPMDATGRPRAAGPPSGGPGTGRPSGAAPGPAPDATASAPRGRRGSADPVRGLMRRHRELCERAVDPLEIAAGLEAHGVTDRTAARFRHRDVFSLAEELFVRVPRAEPAVTPAPGPSRAAPPTARRRIARAVVPVLPGALCAAALVALAVTPRTVAPAVRLGVALAGAAAVLAAVRFAVRGLPRTRTAVLWACWLLAYAVLGDGALTGLLAGGRPAGAVQPDLSVALTLAWAVAPAIWCGRWFARRARSRLPASRSLGDFASGVRPLFAAAVGLFVLALAVLRTAVRLAVETVPVPGPSDGPVFALPGELPRALVAALTGGQSGWQLGAASAAEAALGVLLFTAALLVVHGAPGVASAGLGAACAVESAALGTVLVAQLPGLGVLSRPVEYAVAVAGPAAVPALACAGAAIGLLVQAVRVLVGASAHQGLEGW